MKTPRLSHRLHTVVMIMSLLLPLPALWLQHAWKSYFTAATPIVIILAAYCAAELFARQIVHRNLVPTGRSLALITLLAATLLLVLPSELRAHKRSADTRLLEDLRVIDESTRVEESPQRGQP